MKQCSECGHDYKDGMMGDTHAELSDDMKEVSNDKRVTKKALQDLLSALSSEDSAFLDSISSVEISIARSLPHDDNSEDNGDSDDSDDDA